MDSSNSNTNGKTLFNNNNFDQSLITENFKNNVPHNPFENNLNLQGFQDVNYHQSDQNYYKANLFSEFLKNLQTNYLQTNFPTCQLKNSLSNMSLSELNVGAERNENAQIGQIDKMNQVSLSFNSQNNATILSSNKNELDLRSFKSNYCFYNRDTDQNNVNQANSLLFNDKIEQIDSSYKIVARPRKKKTPTIISKNNPKPQELSETMKVRVKQKAKVKVSHRIDTEDKDEKEKEREQSIINPKALEESTKKNKFLGKKKNKQQNKEKQSTTSTTSQSKSQAKVNDISTVKTKLKPKTKRKNSNTNTNTNSNTNSNKKPKKISTPRTNTVTLDLELKKDEPDRNSDRTETETVVSVKSSSISTTAAAIKLKEKAIPKLKIPKKQSQSRKKWGPLIKSQQQSLSYIGNSSNLSMISPNNAIPKKEIRPSCKKLPDIGNLYFLENSHKNKILNQEIEFYRPNYETDLQNLISSNKTENFMSRHFSSMFTNIRNFYVHTKKKLERRKNNLNLAVHSRNLLSSKNSFLFHIEKESIEEYCRTPVKKLWSSDVIVEEKVEELIEKIENLWPTDEYLWSQEALLEYFSINQFNIEKTTEMIGNLDESFVIFLKEKKLKLKDNENQQNLKNFNYNLRKSKQH